MLDKLTTETRNPNTMNIDELNGEEIAQIINQEDQQVALAVKEVLPEIGQAIELVSERFQGGGRLIYIGAGTSGRLGALDAIELTPTYSVPSDQAFGILAGGNQAMYEAVEGAEDSKELAITDLKEHHLTEKDVVISIAASGRTPYAISAIEYGNQVGALTIAVTCNQHSQMNQLAQVGIAPVVGPEVITGSTRMKAGTAQKMVLNMLSTGVMIRSGKVYQNLMVHVQPTNEKLVARSIQIISEATGLSQEQSKYYFDESHQEVATAIVMAKTGKNYQESVQLLKKHQGRIVDAIGD
ncbi:N-acetylmuramic acid 6-phosphate etherase [Vagococcus humatus]|uniref:N-acetylmuramic acid 6-phosphate etherase n=1 Tax=Vagococcus humatus TaxID=1889241 RepID=A0A429Z8B5_9ENTE|nr:N-acetylmuramic acid 6-phosphate etherase [Vagococcus humatus]RST89934.1 N-acetylmuramic acid 6-phosphate etherase [Vagococcus humatus]